MIQAFIGEKGSGKTLTMSIEAYKKYKKGYKIYSNYHLNFPYTPVTINDLIEFAQNGLYFGNTVFCLDELHIWFNARRGAKQRNIVFNFFLTQSSKNAVEVFYTTQYSRQVDILVRLNTEIVTVCSAKCVVYKTKNSKPYITQNYRPSDSDYKCLTYVKNKITKFTENKDIIIERMFLGNKYFKLYDTRQVIKQQDDVFEQAVKGFKENKGVTKEKITTKQKRLEQHNNRLFHEQNEKMLMGEQ